MVETATGPVGLAFENGLATLTLARPEAGNALDWALVDAFADACLTLAATDGVRAVLLHGLGRNFCVGGDIKVFATETDPTGYIERLARRLHVGIVALAGLAAPVVIAVQGAAAGAGLSLVAGGDLVIAGASSRYTMAYGAIGLTADGGSTWLLPRLIGLRRAQEMAFTNRHLSAEDAERYGLVTRVVADEAVLDEAIVLARAIANGPTFAFGRVKRLFEDSFTDRRASHLDTEATAITEAMATIDARGAIAAFLDRRAPIFDGR